MKKFAIIIVAIFLVLGTGSAVFAKSGSSAKIGNIEADASLVLASPPASGFGTSAGLTIGAGMMLPKVENLQVRIDQSFFSWSMSEFGVDLKYTRYPMTASARYYFPVNVERLKVYGQGGLEVSFDKVESYMLFFGKTSSSTTNFGITPGGGVAYQFNDHMSVGADFRIHLITDSYVTLQGVFAYSF